MPPQSIAVLGGGITGLSSAFHLSRRFPQARIMLFEGSNRVGGWIRSRRVNVKDGSGNNAEMILEAGPRTLRPNSPAVLELTNLLNLRTSVIATPKSSPAAKNRFIHIPGRAGLLKMPSSPLTLLSSPKVASELVPPVLREALRRTNKPAPSGDESLASLMSRRFGAELERKFVSALVHGVYAADSRLLSAKAAFPILLEAEELGGGSIVRGMFKMRRKEELFGYDTGSVPELLRDASVFSFVEGMESIPRALEGRLKQTPNVTIETEAHVRAIRLNESNGVEVSFADRDTITVSHAVSALPTRKLEGLLSPPFQLPSLSSNPSSTVTVVNIVFPPSTQPIHPAGFGYLVSRPEEGYSNPTSGFLGTVFDSCSLGAQDQGSKGFTKLTVMLGGPYTIDRRHSDPSMLLPTLRKHLRGTQLSEPVLYEVFEHKDCIPTPTVGHVERIEELRRSLKDGPWGGKLELVGASVGGVSLGDCIQAGRDVGRDW